MNQTGFYSTFEERHRGTRELIKSRLGIYRPFVEPLLMRFKNPSAIDLGCGRGEWLELMEGWGFDARGIDLDDDMLSSCRSRGLKVQTGDAIAFLQTLPDASESVVSGFHFAEHIPFSALQTLAAEAFRVLRPSGLLILETPNPENVVVGTTNFYLDPTHQRPIPPSLLAFLAEYSGYARVKILRLQEASEMAGSEDVGLFDVFAGVSPDYAIVAQKSGGGEIPDAFREAFDKEYGLELRDLTDRYDALLDRRLSEFRLRLGNAESQAGGISDALARIGDLQDRLIDSVSQTERNAARAELAEGSAQIATAVAQEQEQRALDAESLAREQEQRALDAESLARELEQRALDAESLARELEQRALAAENLARELEQKNHELGGNCHHWWLSASALESERDALRRSWSWRITAPLRGAAGLAIGGVTPLKRGVNHLARISIETLHHPVAILMRPILRRPDLSYRINQRLMRNPALHQQLVRIARQSGVIPDLPNHPAENTAQGSLAASPEPIQLTPRARSIYADLKAAIEKNREVH
ncbi:class I SAM-dependent methyltransferase [Thiocapsa marina]|uniref:Methyltransferase type 11 n=1 Tax=Thiocapsa marina 5811 TaxID=768671 RepID=F9U983_9GAMM|nr:methyltransferase domain-containing protein [Thiocapsa marina]EGV19341.1 Methyltransferase type 11 [Thiocapsa marina 5811]